MSDITAEMLAAEIEFPCRNAPDYLYHTVAAQKIFKGAAAKQVAAHTNLSHGKPLVKKSPLRKGRIKDNIPMVAYSQKLAIAFNIFDTVISKTGGCGVYHSRNNLGHDGLLKIVYACNFSQSFCQQVHTLLRKKVLTDEWEHGMMAQAL
jgi:hypothetical protein